MKHFLYMLISILILGLGSLFVLKKPDGTTWLSTSDFYNKQKIVSKFNQTKNMINNKITSVFETTDSTQIYKWQDENGVWHYSDQKQSVKSGQPVKNVATWIKPNNLTVIPAINVNEVTKNIKKATNQNNNEQLKNEGKSIIPSKVNTLFKDTNNVQSLMDTRTKEIDALL